MVAGRGLEPVSNEAICTENFDWDFQSKFDSDTGTVFPRDLFEGTVFQHHFWASLVKPHLHHEALLSIPRIDHSKVLKLPEIGIRCTGSTLLPRSSPIEWHHRTVKFNLL